MKYIVRIFDKNNRNYEINHWEFNDKHQAEDCKADKKAQGYIVKIDTKRN